jgi:hypothetical protein
MKWKLLAVLVLVALIASTVDAKKTKKKRLTRKYRTTTPEYCTCGFNGFFGDFVVNFE